MKQWADVSVLLVRLRMFHFNSVVLTVILESNGKRTLSGLMFFHYKKDAFSISKIKLKT